MTARARARDPRGYPYEITSRARGVRVALASAHVPKDHPPPGAGGLPAFRPFLATLFLVDLLPATNGGARSATRRARSHDGRDREARRPRAGRPLHARRRPRREWWSSDPR